MKARAELILWVLGTCVVIAILVIIFGVKIHHLNTQVAEAQMQLTQAKSETTQALAEAEKDRVASAGLQSQLDNGKSKSADLQSQLDLSKDASVQLEAQLDKTKAQSAFVQSQLDSSKTQSAGLQSQLNDEISGSSQLLTQLDQAKIRSMDLQSRLQAAENDIAQLQPLLLKARHMPVTTSFESVHGGRSVTLHINNLYLQPVSVDVTITGSDKTRSQLRVIGGGAMLNVENLAVGENVVISSDGCDPVYLTVL